eukprot:6203110-Pleurochrysis_carterae.AAC.6
MIDADVGGEGHLGRTSLLLLCRSSLEVVDLILARHALRLHYRHRVVLAEDKVGPTPLRLHHPARFALARTRRVEQCARGACPIGHAHFRRQELLLRRLFVCGGRHVDGQQAPRLERDGGGEARKLRQPALNVERVRVVLLRPQEPAHAQSRIHTDAHARTHTHTRTLPAEDRIQARANISTCTYTSGSTRTFTHTNEHVSAQTGKWIYEYAH